MKSLVTVILTLVFVPLYGEQRPEPIIDMHVHAVPLSSFVQLVGPAPIPHCVPMTDYPVPDSGSEWLEIFRSRENQCNATWSVKSDQELLDKTLEIMNKRNIIAVTSGTNAKRWKEVAPERIIPSLSFGGGPKVPSIEEAKNAFEKDGFLVFGEVAIQYLGMQPDDPSMQPYWSLMEILNIPVGIHIGTGPVGAPYVGFDGYRARLHSPLVLEEILVKYPKLRVYIMHAGWPMLDDLLAVLWTHPHVYVDIGAICWALPQAEFHRYLQRVVEAGFGKRVLFGSDQMVWPETMEMAIQSIESASFLSPEQKRDIFFNNAARFLKLSQQQIATMHGK